MFTTIMANKLQQEFDNHFFQDGGCDPFIKGSLNTIQAQLPKAKIWIVGGYLRNLVIRNRWNPNINIANDIDIFIEGVSKEEIIKTLLCDSPGTSRKFKKYGQTYDVWHTSGQPDASIVNVLNFMTVVPSSIGYCPKTQEMYIYHDYDLFSEKRLISLCDYGLLRFEADYSSIFVAYALYTRDITECKFDNSLREVILEKLIDNIHNPDFFKKIWTYLCKNKKYSPQKATNTIKYTLSDDDFRPEIFSYAADNISKTFIAEDF